MELFKEQLIVMDPLKADQIQAVEDQVLQEYVHRKEEQSMNLSKLDKKTSRESINQSF